MNDSAFDNVGSIVKMCALALLLLGAIASGVLGALLCRHLRNKYRSYLKTTGMVSEFLTEDGMLRPKVRFHVATKQHEIVNPLAKSSWKIKTGDSVPVIYNPANPEEAEIEHLLFQYLLPAFLFFTCVAGLIFAPIIYFRLN